MQLTVNADSSRTPILANCRTEAMLTGWYSGCVPMGKASRGSKGGKGNDRKSLQSGVGTSYFVDECGFESRGQRKPLFAQAVGRAMRSNRRFPLQESGVVKVRLTSGKERPGANREGLREREAPPASQEAEAQTNTRTDRSRRKGSHSQK